MSLRGSISSIEDVRIGMKESGLNSEQISDIENIASKKYANNNIMPGILSEKADSSFYVNKNSRQK